MSAAFGAIGLTLMVLDWNHPGPAFLAGFLLALVGLFVWVTAPARWPDDPRPGVLPDETYRGFTEADEQEFQRLFREHARSR